MSVFGFHMGMDENSLEIRRDGHIIGYLQKHPGHQPRLVIRESYEVLSLTELEDCLNKLKEFTGRK